MYVLGTAGHIDHGKSVLVRALTGIDPDRLALEKERGMTIDLGFAWLKLKSGREIGIVDVPGHERFVTNMLAGAGSIDVAMLVVAANEGPMPQTREHLAILDLLGIKTGLVALTKKDLVDDEWLEIVKLEIHDMLSTTSLADAPVIPVSPVTGDGIPELLEEIDKLLEKADPRADKGRPRISVDRVFSIQGAGTVVTGTLLDGSLEVGDEVEMQPSGIKTRIRSLQTHKTQEQKAFPGSRVAANLQNISVDDIHRGELMVKPGQITPTLMASARLRVLEDSRLSIKHNTERHVYILAAAATAKVRLLETDELKTGQSGWIQLRFDRPMPIVDGDHFVLRSTSETIGGGVIVESHSRRFPRFKPEIIDKLKLRSKGSPEELVRVFLESVSMAETKEIIDKVSAGEETLPDILDRMKDDGTVISIGKDSWMSLAVWNRIADEARGIVNEYHSKFKLRSGIPKMELGNRLKMKKAASTVIDTFIERGVVVDEGTTVRLPEFTIKLDENQRKAKESFLKALTDNPYSPSSENLPETDILNLLVDENKIVKIDGNIYFERTAYNKMTAEILDYIDENGKLTLAEVRDMFQTSRKYAVCST